MTKIISEIGEKELIKILLTKRDKLLPPIEDTVKQSYHDDAAIIENQEKYTLVSTDMLIQHSHFPENMTTYQMGKKAVTVNVSDIIAMNATPTSILISMGLPPTLTLEDYEQLIQGILDACHEYNIRLIGGDINEHDEIILSGTSIGQADNNIKLQNGIKEGDLVAVTGNLGSPAAALDLINHEDYEDKKIIKTLLEPSLPIKTFKKLRQHPSMVTSLTDITDGLAVELGHLKDKNPGYGFEIFYEKIPHDKKIENIAHKNDKSLEEYLLHFGEEFELLLTLNPEEYNKNYVKELHIIGRTNNSGKITLKKDGEEKNIHPRGYEHLKRKEYGDE